MNKPLQRFWGRLQSNLPPNPANLPPQKRLHKNFPPQEPDT